MKPFSQKVIEGRQKDLKDGWKKQTRGTDRRIAMLTVLRCFVFVFGLVSTIAIITLTGKLYGGFLAPFLSCLTSTAAVFFVVWVVWQIPFIPKR